MPKGLLPSAVNASQCANQEDCTATTPQHGAKLIAGIEIETRNHRPASLWYVSLWFTANEKWVFSFSFVFQHY